MTMVGGPTSTVPAQRSRVGGPNKAMNTNATINNSEFTKSMEIKHVLHNVYKTNGIFKCSKPDLPPLQIFDSRPLQNTIKNKRNVNYNKTYVRSISCLSSVVLSCPVALPRCPERAQVAPMGPQASPSASQELP